MASLRRHFLPLAEYYFQLIALLSGSNITEFDEIELYFGVKLKDCLAVSREKIIDKPNLTWAQMGNIIEQDVYQYLSQPYRCVHDTTRTLKVLNKLRLTDGDSLALVHRMDADPIPALDENVVVLKAPWVYRQLLSVSQKGVVSPLSSHGDRMLHADPSMNYMADLRRYCTLGDMEAIYDLNEHVSPMLPAIIKLFANFIIESYHYGQLSSAVKAMSVLEDNDSARIVNAILDLFDRRAVMHDACDRYLKKSLTLKFLQQEKAISKKIWEYAGLSSNKDLTIVISKILKSCPVHLSDIRLALSPKNVVLFKKLGLDYFDSDKTSSGFMMTISRVEAVRNACRINSMGHLIQSYFQSALRFNESTSVILAMVLKLMHQFDRQPGATGLQWLKCSAFAIAGVLFVNTLLNAFKSQRPQVLAAPLLPGLTPSHFYNKVFVAELPDERLSDLEQKATGSYVFCNGGSISNRMLTDQKGALLVQHHDVLIYPR